MVKAEYDQIGIDRANLRIETRGQKVEIDILKVKAENLNVECTRLNQALKDKEKKRFKDLEEISKRYDDLTAQIGIDVNSDKSGNNQEPSKGDLLDSDPQPVPTSSKSPEVDAA